MDRFINSWLGVLAFVLLLAVTWAATVAIADRLYIRQIKDQIDAASRARFP